MRLSPNVTNYVVHLKNSYSERELHDMVSYLEPDTTAMEEWNLSEDEFFHAVEIAYFDPQEVQISIH